MPKLTEADLIRTFGPIADDLMAIIADDLEQMQKSIERKRKPTTNEALTVTQRNELIAIQQRLSQDEDEIDLRSIQSIHKMERFLYVSLLLVPKQIPKVAKMSKGIMSRHYPRRNPTRDELITAYEVTMPCQ